MAKVDANGITINYERQGTGEPLVLIPYLAADHACYAFQVADYAKHFTCISLDPRGTGETDKPDGTYSMELFADDVAAFRRSASSARISAACRSGRRRVYGWAANIRNVSNRCHCTVAGPRATRSSKPWWRAGRAPPRA